MIEARGSSMIEGTRGRGGGLSTVHRIAKLVESTLIPCALAIILTNSCAYGCKEHVRIIFSDVWSSDHILKHCVPDMTKQRLLVFYSFADNTKISPQKCTTLGR
jgi:hypothetical protein